MISTCYVCGGLEFGYVEVLWDDLVREWQLSRHEADYINRQQGLYCKSCGNNLRSIALARAILYSYGFKGFLTQFVESEAAKRLRTLEINEAGTLTPLLSRLPLHRVAKYPSYDMTKLAFDTAAFDLVVHSDTLEHVKYPLAGLSECRRVLSEEGRCIFTVPIVVDRFTRSRDGLPESHHGSPSESADDYLVHTEFGADVWKYAVLSGFSFVAFHCAEFPAGLTIEARV